LIQETYRVTDGALLGRLMRLPEPGGTAHTARSLAGLVGLSESKVRKLIKETRPYVTEPVADAIASALGVHRKALFSPRSFSFENENAEEDPMDPVDRTLRARLAAHSQWAREKDPTARTEKARKAADSRFVKQARELHPDGDDALIARTAEHLRKAHFTRMGLASAAKRRKGARPEAA
jgi:hypothetical protein